MRATHHTFCRICEALCGLEVDVDAGRVVDVRPDENHVATAGFGCIKGLRQHEIFGSPDRLTAPLERAGTDYQPASWDRALDSIGSQLRQIRRDHGPDSIAMYVGTAAGFGVLHPIFLQGFTQGIGTRNTFSSSTQDCANKFAVAHHMYGFPFTQPFPDVDRTQCLVIVGANPVVSKWSFLQVSNPAARLQALEARGGKLFIIDPRRTETAKTAGEHVFIRAGTDVYFFLSFLNELILTGAVDRARAGRHMTGFDELAELAAPWTPERAAAVTRIEPAKLREIVAAYRSAEGAAVYSSTGVNQGGHGTLAFWLQECINAISGNLDRPGGTLVGHGIFDFARYGKRAGLFLRRDRSRIGQFPSVNDTFPGGVLADEILTPGPRRIRALFVAGGNPLMTMADSAKLRRAFEQLELLVVLDIFQSETASVAHWVLPCTSPLQRPDLPFVFPLLLGLQSRPYLQATRAILPPQGEQRDEATVYLELARAAGMPLWGSRSAQYALEAAKWARGKLFPKQAPQVPQELLLSLLLLATGHGSFGRLVRERHGRLRPPNLGGDFLGQRVVTDDGKVHLAPPALLALAADLERHFDVERQQARRLRLITRRAVTSHNSWTHNVDRFVQGKRATNYLYMHPEDARAAGLESGDSADVTSEAGTVRVPVQTTPDLMPGTVALPHGWGHQMARGLSVARNTRGVNANLLAPSGTEHVDPVSGMSRMTAIPVEVARARGPQEVDDWSGVGRT